MDFYFDFQAKGARFAGQSDQKSVFSPQPPCSYHKKVELAVPKMGQKVVFCFVSCYKNIKITKSVQVHPPSAHEGVNIPSNAHKSHICVKSFYFESPYQVSSKSVEKWQSYTRFSLLGW